MSEIRLIGERGAAFVRLPYGESFDEKCQEIEANVPLVAGMELRTPESSKYPSICLMSGGELRHIPELAYTDAHAAVRHVLGSNPELLRGYDGSENTDAPDRFRPIVFDTVTTKPGSRGVNFIKLYTRGDKRPLEERRLIQKSLSELVAGETIRWNLTEPALTLIAISSGVLRADIIDAEKSVRELLPIEASLSAVRPTPQVKMPKG